MTFTGDELFMYVCVPYAIALYAYVGWLELKYGNLHGEGEKR